jgi:hypothetical protein
MTTPIHIEAVDTRIRRVMEIPTALDIRTGSELIRIATAGKIA